MTQGAHIEIEMDRLREVVDGCGWSIAEFVEFYAPRARREVASARGALVAGDRTSLARLAHGAAGSCATVGMASLRTRYRRVLELAADGQADRLAALMDDIDAHLERVLGRLDELARAGR